LSDPARKDYDPTYVDFLIGDAKQGGVGPGPSFLKKAANFARAAVKHAADGFGVVPDEVREARLARCRPCRFYDDGTCRHEECGCHLETKASWASQACPIDEWGPHEVDGPGHGCSSCGGGR